MNGFFWPFFFSGPLRSWRPTATASEGTISLPGFTEQSIATFTVTVTADQSVLHKSNDRFVVLFGGLAKPNTTLTQQKWGRLERQVHSPFIASFLLTLWSNGIWTTKAMVVVLHNCMKMLHLHALHAVALLMHQRSVRYTFCSWGHQGGTKEHPVCWWTTKICALQIRHQVSVHPNGSFKKANTN